ncbi:zinc-binding alcohol dehydrogenase family protein [Furfurilactobacillus curtus]|uniref:Zinc-type alcohol dehydrogenase-like protein n=1 Tax=Furfurilactobacillus curtus TaxID=1746200 RepID=A0ABQ5JQ76_9LACO
MKIIESFATSTIGDAKAMVDATKSVGEIGANDVLVQVKAVSVNPVDTKLRQGLTDETAPKILGYDATGIVLQAGANVTNVAVNDRVYYAGTKSRDGANAEQQVVDARLVAQAPTTLTDAQAAALPLTSLTAAEVLFEKIGFTAKANANQDQKLLIINGAGGVGSMAIQLAAWAGVQVTATASRAETIDWVKHLGATQVFNHREPLQPQAQAAGIEFFDAILILFNTDAYFETAAQLIKPFGHIASIVGNQRPLALGQIKNKAASFDWEYMFAKSDYQVDLASQGRWLEKIANLMDEHVLKTTLTKAITTGINAQNLRAAHQLVEANQMVGKIVVTGPFNGETGLNKDEEN